MLKPELVLCAVTERTPYPMQELACFASEHDENDGRCRACHLKSRCLEMSGRHGERIRLDQVKFNLMPSRLADAKLEIHDPDASNVQAVYSRLYGTVWPGGKYDAVGRETAERIIAQAEEARCSVHLFIMANMIGFKKANPDRPFYSRMLVGESAVRRAGIYRKTCRERFGSFDETSLEALVGKQVSGLEQRMEDSETIAAGWIVGWKSRHGGRAGLAMLAAKELSLDPVWLAVEPAYAEVIEMHMADRSAASPAVAQHRFNVSRSIAELKRNKRLAISAFETRQNSVHRALARALAGLGYSPDQFEIKQTVVEDPLWLYERVGLAVQHANCLEAASGEPLKSARLEVER